MTTETGIDFDKIRQQVGLKHGFLLDKDDPVLVTVTINETVIEHYLDMTSKLYQKANEALADILQQQIEEQVEQSKGTAGKIITDAAGYVSDQTRQTVTEAITVAGKQLQQQVVEAVTSSQQAQAAKHGAYLAAGLAGFAAVVSVVVALLG